MNTDAGVVEARSILGAARTAHCAERKYLVAVETFSRACEELTTSCTETQGWRATESIGFDTPTLDLYLATALRRAGRFEVRVRTSGIDETVLEVRIEDDSGRIQLRRAPHRSADRHLLTSDACAYIDGVVGVAGASDRLIPMLTTTYERSTLIDEASGASFTADRGFVSTDRAGRTIALDEVVVSSRSSGAGAIDRWLWRRGVRPVEMSTYFTTMAALDPLLPAASWHQTLVDFFGRRTGVEPGLAELARHA